MPWKQERSAVSWATGIPECCEASSPLNRRKKRESQIKLFSSFYIVTRQNKRYVPPIIKQFTNLLTNHESKRKKQIMVGFEQFLCHFDQIANSKSELIGKLCYTGPARNQIETWHSIRTKTYSKWSLNPEDLEIGSHLGGVWKGRMYVTYPCNNKRSCFTYIWSAHDWQALIL